MTYMAEEQVNYENQCFDLVQTHVRCGVGVDLFITSKAMGINYQYEPTRYTEAGLEIDYRYGDIRTMKKRIEPGTIETYSGHHCTGNRLQVIKSAGEEFLDGYESFWISTDTEFTLKQGNNDYMAFWLGYPDGIFKNTTY